MLSPLSMGHPVSVLGEDLGLGGDFAAWRETNLTMLAMSDYLVVLLLEGAEESVGVRAEAAFAREKGIPVWAMRDGESYEPPRPLFEFEEVSL